MEEQPDDSSFESEQLSNDETPVREFESFEDAVLNYRDKITEAYQTTSLPAEEADPNPKAYPDRERDIVSGHQFLVAADLAYGIALSEYYLGNTYAAEDWFETAIDDYFSATTFMFETPFYSEDGVVVSGLSHPNIGGHCDTVLTEDGIARYGTREQSEHDNGYKPEIGTPDHKIDVLYRCLAIAKIIDDDERAEEAADRINDTYIAAHEAGDETGVHVWLTAGFKRGIAGLVIGNEELIEKTSVALNNTARDVELPPELDLQLQIADGFSNKSAPYIRNGIELLLHRHVAKNAGPPIHIPSQLCCIEGTLLCIVAKEQGYSIRDGNKEFLTSFSHQTEEK